MNFEILKYRIMSSLRPQRSNSANSAVKKENDILKYFIIHTFILLLQSSAIVLYCQEVNVSDIISTIAEELAADETDPAAIEIFTDRLQELAENPVMINSADEEEIARLFFLTPFQVKSVIDHIKSTGDIVSVYEIAGITGFDRETARAIQPFVSLDSRFTLSYAPGRITQTLVSNYIIKATDTDTSAPGSAARVLIKYRLNAGRITAGLTGEKDPGEKLFPEQPGIMDFVSGNISYNGPGTIRRIIIGDYSVRFGQGLNINTAYKTNLSLSNPGYLAGSSDIRPYTSADETNFLRGIALMTSAGKFDLNAYYSSNRIDATLSDPRDTNGVSVSSVYRTGYHNTTSSISKKDNLRETGFGVNLSGNFNRIRAGTAFTHTGYSWPVKAEYGDPASLYDFSGYSVNIGSVYYSSIFNRLVLFGEASFSSRKGHSFIQGFSFKPAGRLSINLLLHDYSPQYLSLHGKPPGIGSAPSNEKGIYANFSFEAIKNVFISGGTDLRHFPWLRYRCSSPASSRRSEIMIKYTPSADLTLEGLYSLKYSETDDPDDKGVPSLLGNWSRTARIYLKYRPTDMFSSGTRFDYRAIRPSGKKGYMLFQEMTIRSGPFAVWMRFCIFNTSGYETGIYTWENELPGSYSVPILYGTGAREYIMISYRPNSNIEIRLKCGSVNRRSEDSHYPELKLQLKISV